MWPYLEAASGLKWAGSGVFQDYPQWPMQNAGAFPQPPHVSAIFAQFLLTACDCDGNPSDVLHYGVPPEKPDTLRRDGYFLAVYKIQALNVRRLQYLR